MVLVNYIYDVVADSITQFHKFQGRPFALNEIYLRAPFVGAVRTAVGQLSREPAPFELRTFF